MGKKKRYEKFFFFTSPFFARFHGPPPPPREVDENCARLRYYTASSGISYRRFGKAIGPIFRGSRIGFLTPGTDGLSRNIGKRYQ